MFDQEIGYIIGGIFGATLFIILICVIMVKIDICCCKNYYQSNYESIIDESSYLNHDASVNN